MPAAVPRLAGWTATLRAGRLASSGFQKRRCWASTDTRTLAGGAIRAARARVTARSERPSPKAQNCFGTQAPLASVVSARSRAPSPPASTKAQVFSRVLYTLAPFPAGAHTRGGGGAGRGGVGAAVRDRPSC